MRFLCCYAKNEVTVSRSGRERVFFGEKSVAERSLRKKYFGV